MTVASVVATFGGSDKLVSFSLSRLSLRLFAMKFQWCVRPLWHVHNRGIIYVVIRDGAT